MLGTVSVFLTALVFVLATYFISRKASDKTTRIIIVGLAFAYVLVVQLRSCLPDSFVFVVNSKESVLFDGDYVLSSHDYLQSVLRWGLGLCSVVSVVAVFCNDRFFKNVSVCVCLPFAVVATFFYGDFLQYFLADGVKKWIESGVVIPEMLRHVQFVLELAFAIALPLITLLVQKHKPFAEKGDVKKFLTWIVPTFVLCVPMYVPQSLFGYTDFVVGGFSGNLASYMAVVITVIMCLYFALRNENYDTRYAVSFFVCLVATQFYTQMFVLGHSLSRIGFFQLCNLANYLLLICIVFKSQKLFDFILLANTLGAVIAFCVPDISAGMFEPWNFHFILEHTLILFAPAFMMALRIFERPTKKSLKHCFVGYAIFFGVCLVAGTLINGWYSKNVYGYLHVEVNYFYIFDTKKILDVLSFMKWTTKWKVVFGGGNYVFYPIWTTLFFVLYYTACIGVYYLVNKLASLADEHVMLRNDRLARHAENGKPSKHKPYVKN